MPLERNTEPDHRPDLRLLPPRIFVNCPSRAVGSNQAPNRIVRHGNIGAALLRRVYKGHVMYESAAGVKLKIVLGEDLFRGL